ncbi:MAG TPA: hypothetical protein VN231_01220 [Allosphingosinicella sp.]|nr:hypothetical protein [Allosphingosinicella sp.]
MRQSAFVSLLAALAASGLGACASGYPHGRPGHAADYAYDGGDWAGQRRAYGGDLHGPGLAILDPWLKETAEGRAVVTLGFREAARGFVSEDVAHRANIWFRRYADTDCDMRITDPEIRTALVAAAGRYLR